MSPSALVTAAEHWIAQDVDELDQAALRDLVAAAVADGPRSRAHDELASCLAGPLVFGTAGLRAPMGPGPHRMNRAVVIRAAAGLGRFIQASLPVSDHPRPGAGTVVIGYDGRHRSHQFAVDSAAVLVAAGLEVTLLHAALPTPVLAFAVRQLGADAGIMVTASHNPAADNGYKVYLGGRLVAGAGQGAQLVPPFDAGIASHIAAAGPAIRVPRAVTGWSTTGAELEEAYLAALPSPQAPAGGQPGSAQPLRIVTTALHGVGGPLLTEALRRQGFTEVSTVAEQAEPDPDFPTVAFPNPEEPGTLDLALDLAERSRADLVLALDPDADRCAVAVRDTRLHRDPADTTGAETGAPTPGPAWRRLHGDEVGALLGEHLASGLTATGAGQGGRGEAWFASSIVSSRLLARIAARHGIRHCETLTGFKWIARVPGLVFGYEEAIGYCVDPGHVRDKDGISAALAVANLASELQESGRTLLDALDDLALEHGIYATAQVNERFPDPTAMAARVASLLADPPATLDGSQVSTVTDLSTGHAGLPPTPGVRLLAANGTRVIVRPSGTEPKLKTYFEVIEPVSRISGAAELRAARQRAGDRLARLACSTGRAG